MERLCCGLLGVFGLAVAQAAPLSLEIDTGDELHIATLTNAAPILIVSNGVGKVTVRMFDTFGNETPIDVGCGDGSSAETRVAVPWPLKKGVYRLYCGDATVNFAVLKPHRKTPPLPPGKFRIGLNYHFRYYDATDENMRKTLRALDVCGAKLVRGVALVYRDIAREDGTFDWNDHGWDDKMKLLADHGLPLDAIYQEAPTWTMVEGRWNTSNGWRNCLIPPKSGYLKDFSRELARRYGNRIAYYEVGNELDLVPTNIVSTADQVRMQREAWEGVHEVDPDLKVINAGLTYARSSDLPSRIPPNRNEDFLTQAKDWIDVQAVHQHAYFTSYKTRVARLEESRRELGLTMPWYSNESALSALPGEEDEAGRTVMRNVLYAWAHGSRDYIWYNLRATGADLTNSEHAFGIITQDYHPRAMYPAFCALTWIYHGLDFERTWIDDAELERFVFGFQGKGGKVLAAWFDGAEKDAEVCVRTDAKRVYTVDHMGNETQLVIKNGVVRWPVSLWPRSLVCVGATVAVPDRHDLLRPVPEDDAVLKLESSQDPAKPMLTLDRHDQVKDYNRAIPDLLHRQWKGPSDLSAKVWICRLRASQELRFVIDVTDDCDTPNDRLELVFVQSGRPDPLIVVPAGDYTDLFTRTRVEGVTRYDFKIPYAAGALTDLGMDIGFGFELKIYDDDGEGEDGWIQLAPVGSPCRRVRLF